MLMAGCRHAAVCSSASWCRSASFSLLCGAKNVRRTTQIAPTAGAQRAFGVVLNSSLLLTGFGISSIRLHSPLALVLHVHVRTDIYPFAHYSTVPDITKSRVRPKHEYKTKDPHRHTQVHLTPAYTHMCFLEFTLIGFIFSFFRTRCNCRLVWPHLHHFGKVVLVGLALEPDELPLTDGLGAGGAAHAQHGRHVGDGHLPQLAVVHLLIRLYRSSRRSGEKKGNH